MKPAVVASLFICKFNWKTKEIMQSIALALHFFHKLLRHPKIGYVNFLITPKKRLIPVPTILIAISSGLEVFAGIKNVQL